jgi:hypothetical protein
MRFSLSHLLTAEATDEAVRRLVAAVQRLLRDESAIGALVRGIFSSGC